MQGVERLSLVAKVLMDTRLLELKRENEELKLKLFWKDHNPSMLKKTMAAANKAEGGPRCACLACIVGGRCVNGTQGFAPYPFVHEYDHHFVLSAHDRCHLRCQFKPWFEERIRESGMSVRDRPSSVWVDNADGGVVGDGAGVMDDGHHFIHMGRVDWNAWGYGSRLWKASSVADQELGKLKALFETLTLPVTDELGLPIVPSPVSATYTTIIN